MIALGTKLICREFGHEVTVTNVDEGFIEYVGDNSEGSVRSDHVDDFFRLDEENGVTGPSVQ